MPVGSVSVLTNRMVSNSWPCMHWPLTYLSGPAKDTFIKAVLKQYGKVDEQAQTHKVMQARARFLYRAGRLLLQWPDSKVSAGHFF